MSSSRLSPEQVQFIENLASLLTTWSLSPNAARLYGYLQLKNEPVSLDDIATDLEISRSHAHTAARMLETAGNARAMATRGSKRIVYVCGDDPATPLRPQAAALGKMSELIAASASHVATGEAAARLAHLGNFHARLRGAMQDVIDPQPIDKSA
jgi:DNA-binding transcriptional regulator GbsR (MarR family)